MDDALGIGLAATQVGIAAPRARLPRRARQPGQRARQPRDRVVRRRTRRRRGGLPEPARRPRRRRAPDPRPRRAPRTSTASRSSIEASGLEARVIQHEIDHLDGVLILDRTSRDQRKEAMRDPARARSRRPRRRRACAHRLPRHVGLRRRACCARLGRPRAPPGARRHAARPPAGPRAQARAAAGRRRRARARHRARPARRRQRRRSARARIAAAAPDAVVVCAFGALIKEPLLSDHEMLNVHPSLLPRWRGAAPVERAIMAGDAQTGVVDHAPRPPGSTAGRSACSSPSRSAPTTLRHARARGCEELGGDAARARARRAPAVRRAARGRRHLRREDHRRGPHARPRRARRRRTSAIVRALHAAHRRAHRARRRRPSSASARARVDRRRHARAARGPARGRAADGLRGLRGCRRSTQPPRHAARRRLQSERRPAPRPSHCTVVLRTLRGAAPTPTARCTARPAASTPATARSPSGWPSAPSSAAATLDWVIAAHVDRHGSSRSVRAALQLGLYQLLFLDGSPTTPRSPSPSSWPSRAPATGSSTRCCAASSARACELPADDDARGRRDPPLAPASGSSSCGGTGSAPTRPARCWPPTTSRPSSRCASTRWPALDARRRRTGPPRGRGARRRRPVRRARPSAASRAGAITPQSRAVAARRARASTRSPASACSTSAPRRAARRRTSPR